MTIHDVKIEYQRELAKLYPSKEIQSIFELIAEDSGFSKLQLITEQDSPLTETNISHFFSALERLKISEPVQYVRGKADFFDMVFSVNASVLIPRGETEELVDLIIRENPLLDGNILDLGTGSGCIAITLAKKLSTAHVYAIDISHDAIITAKKNAQNLNAPVRFSIDDMCDPSISTRLPQCDIIVSNPPYVCMSDKASMHKNVLNYEPSSALFVEDDNPLQYYKAICEIANTNLKQGGKVYCEIHECFGKETVLLFQSSGFEHCEIIKDLYGKDRIIKSQKK